MKESDSWRLCALMSEWQHGGSDAQQGVPKEGKHAPLADDVLAMIGKVSLQESENEVQGW